MSIGAGSIPSTRKRTVISLSQYGLLIAAPVAVAVLMSGAAWAKGDGCDPYDTLTYKTAHVTNCQLQEQSAIKYSAWETKGWAYYCSGDHPYAWNYNNGYIFSYTFDNTCFNITENVGSEGSSNKYDFTITNFCLKSDSFVIKLVCSDTAPPSSASRR